MSIVSRIRAFQIILAATALAIALTAFLVVRGAGHYFDRVGVSRDQVDAMSELAIRANRYSEQIAELLLIGEPERAEFEDSRKRLIEQLDVLRGLVAKEDDLFAGTDDEAEEREETVRLERMRSLLREINRAVERVLVLNQNGKRDEAITLFRSEIENRFDKEFESLISEAVEDERGDVVEADATARKLLGALLMGAIVAVAALLAIVVVTGFVLTRSLRRPIAVLSDATRAIEQGDLAHRIDYATADEFGVLAGRFNAMSRSLEDKRSELVAARDDLERQVAERTREIADANMQLTELDRQRVRFLGDISHELKTPLAVLRAEAEVALRGGARPEPLYRSALESIVSQAAEMGVLVDDLLFIARSEADEIRFEFRPVGLDGALVQAVQDAALLAKARGIWISLDCPSPAPTVRADPRRLKQALLVTLDNAARYADEGSEIRVVVQPPDGTSVEICVRDRGPGIPPEEAALVFERFYRGTRAIEEGRGGSGLGLPIARWIVERHNGRVDLFSTPGEGTEVRLSLPLAA